MIQPRTHTACRYFHSMGFLNGARFGRFTVGRKLGAGGMGEVYAAHDRQSDRHVALKVIHPYNSQDPDYQRRFKREARMLRDVKHERIPRYYEDGIEQGQLWIAMELIRGETLRARLAPRAVPPDDEMPQAQPSRTAMAPDDLLELVGQIASALDAVHGADIVHRDIKPENLIITMRDGAPAVFVVDFGVAQGSATYTTNAANTPGIAPRSGS